MIGRDRPDIPLLVVEDQASTDWLNRTGANLAAANLFRMPNTSDPRDYLQAIRIMLAPSVWQESFGLVAAEAIMNRIPAIGGTGGALPEAIAGYPMALTPPTQGEEPTAERFPIHGLQCGNISGHGVYPRSTLPSHVPNTGIGWRRRLQ